MVSGSVVFYKIATTCLLIFVGYIVRRMKLLPENSVTVMSKYIMYVGMPAYMIFYMPATISRETLGANWFFPLLGIYLIIGSDVFGWLTARLWAKPGDVATFRSLVGLPNWVFMALAVCEPMFGNDGIRIVLLYNLGIMFYMWSFAMTSFRPGVDFKTLMRQLFLNVPTVANFIGFALAMLFPFLKGMEKLTSTELAALPWSLGLITPVWETIYFLSSTTLPLSIFQIGIILGAPRTVEGMSVRLDNRSMILISALRLLAAPALSILMLLLASWAGVPLTRPEFLISVITMAMPAAVLCITVSEVYGGNGLLAARVVLWSSVASLATAPILTWMASWVQPWA